MVTIPVNRRLLSYWDEKTANWVTPKGTVPVSVGFSLDDTPLGGEMTIVPRRN
jgi:beta-glucosidase